MVVLHTGPENALALLALARYHTCTAVNVSCTAAELVDDAKRLRAKAIVTTCESEERLELLFLRDKLGCEIIYVEPRSSCPAGLFDMSLLNTSEEISFDDLSPRKPSKLHGLYVSLFRCTRLGLAGKRNWLLTPCVR